MARTRITEAQRRAHWAGHVQTWSQSGQSVAAYCREVGICAKQLRAWRQRLRYEERKASSSSAPPALIPVAVEPSAPARATLSPNTGSGLVIRLASGVGIEVGVDFEAATLRAVIQALGSDDVLA